jgi:L-gulonate 3-dehydrogenase
VGDDVARLPQEERVSAEVPVRRVPVAVVGAGSIGVAWAIVFARAGHPVAVCDSDPARIEAAPRELRERLVEMVAHGFALDIAEVVDRVSYGTSLPGAVEAAEYVQECVVESVEAKSEVFHQLDTIAPPHAVLASSTSMIPVSRFATELAGRARCLVVHPGNPPYLLPVAELVPAPFTAPETVARARALLQSAGMTPVDVRTEVEGFVFNRLQGALLREAYCLVRDGVVTASDVDRIVRLGLGRRWSVLGPFATSDLNTRGGLERHAAVMGPAYLRMGAERGQPEQWTPELVSRIADEIHSAQPLADWSDHVLARDRALMAIAARDGRAQPDSSDRDC